jgi:hypothetical protein
MAETPKWVRVKDKSTGHTYTVLAAEAENNPDAYQVLKQPAVNENGDPLPGEIPAASSGQSAATTKNKE